MRSKPNDEFLTSNQVAAIIGVTPDYIRHLIHDGKIKAVKVGRDWLIRRRIAEKITRQRFPKKEKDDQDGSNK